MLGEQVDLFHVVVVCEYLVTNMTIKKTQVASSHKNYCGGIFFVIFGIILKIVFFCDKYISFNKRAFGYTNMTIKKEKVVFSHTHKFLVVVFLSFLGLS